MLMFLKKKRKAKKKSQIEKVVPLETETKSNEK